MAKARKKASKRRSKAKRNPLIVYPKSWKPSDTVRWAATATRPEIEERLEMVRAELETPSSGEMQYVMHLMQDEFALNDALAARHPMRKEPKPISGEIIVNPWSKQMRSKKKFRKKRIKNPALVNKTELGYFYEDGIRDFKGSALVGQDLSGMDLRGAIFRNANLYNVNFSGADLRGVDFRGADLGATDFRGAKVDLDTWMDGANLKDSLGPPDYYEGDRKVILEEMTGLGGPVVDVEMSGKDQYVVAPTPGSILEGQLTPTTFKGPNAMRDAMDFAKDAAATAATMAGTSDEDADMLRSAILGDKKAVRRALGRVDEVESFEPPLGGIPLAKLINKIKNLLFDYGLGDRVTVQSYHSQSPSHYPLYLLGAIRFSSSSVSVQFDRDLENLGVRILDGEAVGAKGVVPVAHADAVNWAEYLEAYNDAHEQLKSAGRGQSNPKRGTKTPEWKRLINRCQRLWEDYDKKCTKKNLLAFGKHIEKMKDSRSARVRAEARKAARAYNAEFKAHGWKKPAPKKKAKKKSTRTRRKNPSLKNSLTEVEVGRPARFKGPDRSRGSWQTGELDWGDDRVLLVSNAAKWGIEVRYEGSGSPYSSWHLVRQPYDNAGEVVKEGNITASSMPEALDKAVGEVNENWADLSFNNPSKRKTAKKKVARRKNPKAGKAKFMREMQKVLDKFRDKEKKLMEKEGIRYDDPLADVFLREEDGKIVLYYDGAGFDYLSVMSPYQMKLREDIIEKADKMGWMADDLTHYSMVFWPA